MMLTLRLTGWMILKFFDKVVKHFEKESGAILSRNKKCKVIGFGNWTGLLIG